MLARTQHKIRQEKYEKKALRTGSNHAAKIRIMLLNH
eukprot:SAG11_NODE_21452_length_424_cov_5.735385_1_plen_36_part_10